MAHSLTQQPLEEEARVVLSCFKKKKLFSSLSNGKSPGHDEFTSEFLKKMWHVVKKYIMQCVKQFEQKKPILKGANHTAFITLIPKFRTISEMGDFKPISCVDFMYMLLTKTLAETSQKTQCW